jgi:Ser/Thr protein kinase RdoA (MazF antagonist)
MSSDAASSAAEALERYGFRDADVDALSNVDCAVFRVRRADTSGGRPQTAVLKIYPAHKRDAGAIDAEVDWLLALGRDTTLRVPQPIAAIDGSIVHEISTGAYAGRRAVLFTWIDGQSLDRELSPPALRRIGAFVGALHRHSAGWRSPNKERLTRRTFTQRAFQWVLEMPQPPTLSREEWRVLTAAAERLQHDVIAIGEAPEVFGFVHSDLYLSNFLFSGDEVGVIDFSDCAWGHYADDIASVLVFLRHPFVGNFDHTRQYPALRDGFLAGYEEHFRLPARLDALLTTYFAARIFLVWAYVHEASAFVSWVPECVARSRRFLEEYLAGGSGVGGRL